jgi:hypothetical protein
MRFISTIALLAALALGMPAATEAKKDCVSAFSPYSTVAIAEGMPAVTLSLFSFPVVSPICQKFKLSTDTTTITNKKVSFVEVGGDVLVQNVGGAEGTIIFTPILSQQQTSASAKQNIEAGGFAMVPMSAVPRIETGETVKFTVTASGPGAVFVVGGELSSVAFSIVNQPLSALESNVTDAARIKEMGFEKLRQINQMLNKLRG